MNPDAALPLLPPGAYDCVQSNLALLVAAAGGDPVALGAELVVRPRPLGDGLATVDPDPVAEVRRCTALLGGDAGPGRAVAPGQLRDAGPGYAIGDAFSMPWLPYAGHAHMEHSFLVGPGPDPDTAQVVDAYDNVTEWGRAEPGTWTVPWAELAFPVRLWRWAPDTAPPAAPRRVERCDVGPYLAGYRDHPDRGRAWTQLAVETWLLARRHRLFALAHPGDPAAEAAATAAERLAGDVFLGLRRVRRGRPEPAGALEETARLLALPL